VRSTKLWKKLLNVEHIVFEGWDLEAGPGGGEVLVFRVRPDRAHRDRCSRCGRRARRRDEGDGRRRWRALDLGTTRCQLAAGAPRVSCPAHGVVVAAVPWARPGSRFTTAFEDQAAWLCARMPVSAAAVLMRTTWRSLQAILVRVTADLDGGRDRLEGLRRIGIDEKAWRKGHRYITVITDHDTGRLIWAAEGRNQDTLRRFFGDLGPERSALLEQVSADGAEWIHAVVTEKAPGAVICLDPFHIVKWGTGALDKLRRRLAAELRGAGKDGQASTIKGTRWALIKNPADLSPDQRGTLAQIARDNRHLYRGYLMKEQLRQIFAPGTVSGRALLAGLISWASHSKIPEFAALARTLKGFRQLIWNTLDHKLSNGRAEGVNTQLAALTVRARGFHSAAAFIAMANLTSGGLCPSLPGRSA
jgi:transposase